MDIKSTLTETAGLMVLMAVVVLTNTGCASRRGADKSPQAATEFLVSLVFSGRGDNDMYYPSQAMRITAPIATREDAAAALKTYVSTHAGWFNFPDGRQLRWGNMQSYRDMFYVVNEPNPCAIVYTFLGAADVRVFVPR